MSSVKDAASEKGIIFNIQRFSLHDGPGIRDLVFLKGCPLRCQWCSNPESQNPQAEVAYNPNRCIGLQKCGLCSQTCPKEAIQQNQQGEIIIDRNLCDDCGRCAQVCPADALKVFGTSMTVTEVIKVAEEDGSFYSRSGGGVTVSGGEPLMQPAFVEKLLAQCRKDGISTAIETCGYGNFDDLANICLHADVIFFDLKCMDSQKHKKYTGVSNQIIKENLLKLAEKFPDKPVIVRTPLIPGVNDTVEDIEKIVQFIKGMPNLKEYELLPYHRLGEPKYSQLGRKYALTRLKPLEEGKVNLLKEIAAKAKQKDADVKLH